MIRRTACNRDCPDTCALEVEIDPTTNRAVAIRGVRDDPVTQGFLCERTQRFLSRQYAADRLVEPLLRHEGKLRPVSWSAALDLAASKLNRIRAEYGGAAILNYRSGGSLGILKQIADHFFNAFGPVTAKRGDVCSGAGESAQMRDFGVSESNDLFDLFSSRTILLWGKNPHTSGVHLLPVLREARRRGAFVAGCDPIRTRAVTLCDAFLVPRPGRDFAAALGMARWLFDHDCVDPNAARRCDGLDRFSELVHELDFAGWAKRAGVLPAELERVAQRYGAEGPSAILIGWG
ncbi:MAG: molybdopterin-dependent oxidoreductase, partial [Planctomycetes bacterium]|nr:molybdopterin-dependent oxidoreductase [Planctomycetota bacterium]